MMKSVRVQVRDVENDLGEYAPETTHALHYEE
jgi:hypothetical protein